jgi:hypothetical protein
MNILNTSLKYIESHPHFLRGYDKKTPINMEETCFNSWNNGLLNVIVDYNTKQTVGMFIASIIKKEWLPQWTNKYPELKEVNEDLMMILMVHLIPKYKIPLKDIFRMMYRTADTCGVKKMFYIDRGNKFYTFDKKKYTTNGSYKYLIVNKNIVIEV